MPIALRYFILTLLLCTFIGETSAQRRRKSTLWDGVRVTPRAGANFFFGDLVDKSTTNYSFGVVAEKELSPYLSARVQLMGGSMKGTQIHPIENTMTSRFENIYGDFSVGASFRPIDLAFGYFKQRSFNPYIIGQFGVAYYNADNWYGPSGYIPNSFRHNVSGISPIISGGLGLSYWVSSKINVNIELVGTMPFSDLMDGHENWMYDGPDGQPVVVPTKSYDFYYTATAGVSFLINDSQWKNEPKYNRKAYMKTRNARSYSGNKKNVKSINKKRRRSRR